MCKTVPKALHNTPRGYADTLQTALEETAKCSSIHCLGNEGPQFLGEGQEETVTGDMGVGVWVWPFNSWCDRISTPCAPCQFVWVAATAIILRPKGHIFTKQTQRKGHLTALCSYLLTWCHRPAMNEHTLSGMKGRQLQGDASLSKNTEPSRIFQSRIPYLSLCMCFFFYSTSIILILRLSVPKSDLNPWWTQYRFKCVYIDGFPPEHTSKYLFSLILFKVAIF